MWHSKEIFSKGEKKNNTLTFLWKGPVLLLIMTLLSVGIDHCEYYQHISFYELKI